MNLPLHASPSALATIFGAAGAPPSDDRTELLDALRTTNEAIELAVQDMRARGEPVPLCLALVFERNDRLLTLAELA